METNTLKIDYFEKLWTLEELDSLICDFRCRLGSFHMPKETEEKVLNKLTELVKERHIEVEKKVAEVIDFFKTKLCRFWCMTITTENTYGHKYKTEYLIYPYKLLESNNYLQCIHVQKNDKLIKIYDSGLVIDEIIKNNCTVELQEIDENGFLASVYGNLVQMVNGRRAKIDNQHKNA